MAPTTLPRRNIVGPRIGGSASRRPAFPSLVPRERSTRGSGARTRGTRHAVGPRRERGPPARIPRRQARLPGDAGQRPALPSLVPRERSTRGSGARTRGTRHAVGPRRDAGQRPASRADRRGSPGMRASGPRSQASFHASVQPEAPVRGRGEHGTPLVLAGSAGRRPASAPPGAVPGDAGQRPALPSLVPRERSTRGSGARTRGNTARRWSSPGARAAGPHPAPTGAAPRGCGPAARAPKPRSTRAFNPRLRCADAREHGTPLVLAGSAGRRPASRADRRGSPGMRASGPRSQASFHASVQPEAPVRGREGTRHAVGPRRERGPPARIPRRQARLPGDAGQRPALPSLVPRERSTRGSGARTRGNTARRWSSPGARAAGPHPAPTGAAPRGCGPAARAPKPRSTRAFNPRLRCADAGNTARRWSSPGARAAGPHPAPTGAAPRGCGPAARAPKPRSTRAFNPRLRCADAGNTARRWSSPGARAAGPHPAPTGAAPRGCGPAARAPKPRSTRAFNPRLRCADAGNTARRWSSPGARAAGPHPRRQARFPGMRASGPRSQGSSRKLVDLTKGGP